MGEDRALVVAVAAPRPRQAQHFHVALEAGQHLTLRIGEGHLLVECLPRPPMLFSTVFGEEIVVFQAGFELLAVIEHDCLSRPLV